MRMASSSAQSTTSSQCDTCMSHVCSWSWCLLKAQVMTFIVYIYSRYTCLYFSYYIFFICSSLLLFSLPLRLSGEKVNSHKKHVALGEWNRSESQWIRPRLATWLPPLRPNWALRRPMPKARRKPRAACIESLVTPVMSQHVLQCCASRSSTPQHRCCCTAFSAFFTFFTFFTFFPHFRSCLADLKAP